MAYINDMNNCSIYTCSQRFEKKNDLISEVEFAINIYSHIRSNYICFLVDSTLKIPVFSKMQLGHQEQA